MASNGEYELTFQEKAGCLIYGDLCGYGNYWEIKNVPVRIKKYKTTKYRPTQAIITDTRIYISCISNGLL